MYFNQHIKTSIHLTIGRFFKLFCSKKILNICNRKLKCSQYFKQSRKAKGLFKPLFLFIFFICNLKSKSHQTHWVDVFLDLYFAIYGRTCFNMPCISLFIFVFFQDVVCCHYCETPFPPLHCDLCHQNICNDCEAKHVSELSKPHEIVPFKERGSTPICTKHYCKIIDTVPIVTFLYMCSALLQKSMNNTKLSKEK